jgi:hypothetical protein
MKKWVKNGWLPTGNLTTIEHFLIELVDLPIKDGGFP